MSKLIINSEVDLSWRSLLGKGAHGEVYLASQSNSSNKFAVKKFRLTSETGRTAFLNESNFAAVCKSHNYCVPVHACIRGDDFGYLVMDLMKGDLMDHLSLNPHKRTEAKIRSFFIQLCEAIAELHSSGICHLDIKPENILLDYSEKVKLCDFSSAVFIEEGIKIQKGVRGTKAYAAPELSTNPSFCGVSADVWSLGITLFVLLTGFFPFKQNSSKKNLFSIENLHLDPCGLSESCHDLLSKLLHSDPEKRPNVEQIFSHPWMVQQTKTSHLKSPVIQKWKSFKKFCYARKTIL